MNTSRSPLVSPAMRFEASDWNATKRPDHEIVEAEEKPLPSVPSPASLTRVVLVAPASSKIPSASVSLSRMKTSAVPFVSPSTRFVATDTKETYLPDRDT
jgi:hypothetical protein